MKVCALYEGVNGVCDWCSNEREQHALRYCRRCSGWGSTPDPLDRASFSLKIPTYLWRHEPCLCECGIVTMEGQPVSREQARAAGINVTIDYVTHDRRTA